MSHHCHRLGCKAACPPRWLMCKPCWSLVPADLQAEVYRTVGMRGTSVDATWAPWWRAQARAIAHVANIVEPNADKFAAYIRRAMDFADRLESPGHVEAAEDRLLRKIVVGLEKKK